MAYSENITALLSDLGKGNKVVVDQLVPLVYTELRKLAHHKLRYERDDLTLNTTALVHETYFRLIDQHSVQWQNRSHFFAIAAQAMRRIVLNYAEKKRAAKRGGGEAMESLDDALEWLTDEQSEEILILNDALERLKLFDERGYLVVTYRFFGGLNYEEVAEMMNLSVKSVRNSWSSAKLWLNREINETVH
jgi:RNA polymerase sigma factor (TIGR02999 family)